MAETKKLDGRGCRRKGMGGEREFARLLTDALGQRFERNVDQSRAGGGVDLAAGPYAVQVKRGESLSLAAWWRQAVAEAERAELRPALAYRQNRQPWRVVIRLCDLFPAADGVETVTLSFSGFAQIVRESLNAE